jgi:hypothetical protein
LQSKTVLVALCGIVKELMNKLEMVITLEMGQISPFVGALELWLVPFVVKHESIRLVSIKD